MAPGGSESGLGRVSGGLVPIVASAAQATALTGEEQPERLRGRDRAATVPIRSQCAPLATSLTHDAGCRPLGAYSCPQNDVRPRPERVQREMIQVLLVTRRGRDSELWDMGYDGGGRSRANAVHPKRIHCSLADSYPLFDPVYCLG